MNVNQVLLASSKHHVLYNQFQHFLGAPTHEKLNDNQGRLYLFCSPRMSGGHNVSTKDLPFASGIIGIGIASTAEDTTSRRQHFWHLMLISVYGSGGPMVTSLLHVLGDVIWRTMSS